MDHERIILIHKITYLNVLLASAVDMLADPDRAFRIDQLEKILITLSETLDVVLDDPTLQTQPSTDDGELAAAWHVSTQ